MSCSGDLAVGFAELGMTEAARDSYLLLTVTAQTKWVLGLRQSI